MAKADKKAAVPVPKYMTVNQYAQYIGRPAPTIRLMCLQGRMPGCTMPGTEYIIEVELAKEAVYLTKGRQRKGKEPGVRS
jgi:hypothetical protein